MKKFYENAEIEIIVLNDEDVLTTSTDIIGGVDGDDAGGALADGVIVHQLLLCRPAVLLHDHPLDKAQHGISAAEAHRAHFREDTIQFPKTQIIGSFQLIDDYVGDIRLPIAFSDRIFYNKQKYVRYQESVTLLLYCRNGKLSIEKREVSWNLI